MAVSMTINLPDFLTSLYGPPSDQTPHSAELVSRAYALEKAGWKFSFSMFMVTAKSPGHWAPLSAVAVPENMPSLIPSMMAGKLSVQQRAVFRQTFAVFITSLWGMDENYSKGLTVPAPAISAEAEKTALKKKMVEAILHGKPIVGQGGAGSGAVPTATTHVDPDTYTGIVAGVKLSDGGTVPGTPAPAKMAPKKKPAPSVGSSVVCKLAEAKHVGQLVFGTSAGSHYRTVAVGLVNVAAKVAPTGVSLRVEGKFTTSLIETLSAMGFSKKATYMSMHAATSQALPPARVVGAVLMSMGVSFDDCLTDGSQLK